MKLKKLMSLVAVAAVMTSVVAGCGKKEEVKQPEATKSEPVSLKWIQVGSGKPKNYDAWKTNIDKYLADKVGVNLDMEIVPWGDWGNRRNVIVNSGEAFDMLFTDGGNYTSDVNVGAYADITDLVKTKTPDLYKLIPENYWDAAKVNGKVYAVPTYKDSSMSNYFIWDKAKAEKYNIDYNNIHDLAALDPALRTLKEKEGKASLILGSGGMNGILMAYDGMSAGLTPLGVRYDDQSRKVVDIFEQEDTMSQLEYLHKWYKEGIINADAPTLNETPSYMPVAMGQGWKTAAKTVWGPNMGVEAEAVQYGNTIVSNDTVRGSLTAISSGSKNIEKCLEFLQVVNTDSKVRDALYYGLEGENFQYENGKVKKLNTDWTMAGYTQGTFFNVTTTVEDTSNQWEEVKQLNESAKPSVLIGFSFDTSKVQNEIANCRAVYDKYKKELLTGAKEPKAQVAAMRKELDAAGFQTIIDEAQKQIDAFAK